MSFPSHTNSSLGKVWFPGLRLLLPSLKARLPFSPTHSSRFIKTIQTAAPTQIPPVSELNELQAALHRGSSTQELSAGSLDPVAMFGEMLSASFTNSSEMELRPQMLTACSFSLLATVDTSYNLLPLQEDLISGLKGSRIILYPISLYLCELTMASF